MSCVTLARVRFSRRAMPARVQLPESLSSCQCSTRFKVSGTTGGAAALLALFSAALRRFCARCEGGFTFIGSRNRSKTGLVPPAPYLGSQKPLKA